MAGIVHIIDDDGGVRDSLCALLSLKGYDARGHSSSAGFLSGFAPESALCIVADLRMPGMGGLELQEHLAGRAIAVPFIVITGHGDVPSAVKALKSGAADFIEKPVESVKFLAAVERAAQARRKALAEARNAAEAVRKIELLTPREREVLQRIVDGHPNKIIAHELGISPRTVENHRARLMARLQADGVADLVRIAIEGKLSAAPRIDGDQSAAV